MAFSMQPSFTVSHSLVVLPAMKSHVFLGRLSYRRMHLFAAQKIRITQDQPSMAFPLEEINNDDITVKHARKLKEERNLLSKVGEDPLESLIRIDALQRLGIDYHFKVDIEAILKNQYDMLSSHGGVLTCDLHEAALRFRLLRQQGYPVSSDVFNNFTNEEGKFDQALCKDFRGLTELHEASQLSIEGEDLLDEARVFSGQLLDSWLPHLDDHQSQIVANTLKHPYHMSLTKFLIKGFLSGFRGTKNNEDTLRELAQIDFNMTQSLHQEEIFQVTKWWNELGLAKELKFTRDQPLKWYMWSMTVLTDPGLSWQRVELAKPISLVYVMDDIFDLSGTPDELTLFTAAVNRWDIAIAEQLPDHMKLCLKALYDTTTEISLKVYKDHGWNPMESLQKAWARLCNAFLQEAKWFATGNLPRAEDYLDNGIISSGVHLVFFHVFFLLGDGITKENVDLVDGMPAIISSMATILRLWDDLGSSEDEDQDGYDGSYVECYMREHPGMTVDAAREHVTKRISDAWKRLNQACLFSNPFSPSFTKAVLNCARLVPLMYGFDENHHLPGLEKYLQSVLFEKIST